MSSSLSDLTDLQVALAVLVDGGASVSEAQAALINSPELVGRLEAAGKLSSKRSEFAAQEREAAERAFAESPTGRREAALAALAEERERAQAVEGAQALLRAQGVDPEGMSERELLTVTGIETRTRSEMSFREWDAEVERFAGNAHRLSLEERVAEAQRLDVDLATVERYTEAFGTEGGES